MNIEISSDDLERLEDIIFGTSLVFNQPWKPEHIEELKSFWIELKSEMDGGFGYSLPRIFKGRIAQ